MNFSLLNSPRETIAFELFDGLTLRGQVKEFRAVLGTVILLTGTFVAPHEGYFTLAFEGSTASGSITVADKRFSIRHVADSMHILVEENPLESIQCAVSDARADIYLPSANFSSFSADEIAASSTSGTPAAIDLLVVYTPAALSANPSLRAAFVSMISQLNNALARSQINATVEIIHMQEVQYTEDGNVDIEIARLQDAADGFLDDVPQLRNGLGADLVCLVVNSLRDDAGTTYTGWGNILTISNESQRNIYSLVSAGGIFGTTVAHEIGHNLGSNHNREILQPWDPAYFSGYSYGYRSPAGQYSTIMAYPITGYPTIDYFSNPNVLYNGHPTGIAPPASNAADNGATFNYTAPRVAAWRSATRLTSPRFNNGSFQADIVGPAGSGNVEYSADLLNWQVLASASSGGSFTDTSSAQASIRFYRTSRVTTDFTSANIVGFVRSQLSAGDNFVANPLSTGNPTVATLLWNAADGTQIFKFDESTQSHVLNEKLFGQWTNPNMTLAPGEGVIVRVQSAVTLTFLGEVLEGQLLQSFPTSATLMLRSSMVPQAALLESTLGFAPYNGDQVFLWNASTQSYLFYEYTFGVWLPSEPSIQIGTCFWIQQTQPHPTGRPRSWLRNFWVTRNP